MKISVTFRSEIHGKVLEQTASAEFNESVGITALLRTTNQPTPEILARERARALFQAIADGTV